MPSRAKLVGCSLAALTMFLVLTPALVAEGAKEAWSAFQAELQKRGISAADIEKIEMRPTENPGDLLAGRHGLIDITVTLRLAVPNHGANSERRMGTFLSDLEDFVHDHRPHGPLTADATEPA